MTRTALILVAAGKGTRAKTTIPKQYERIGDKTLLSHTLSNLRIAHDFTEIRVVVSTDDIWIDTELEMLGLTGVTTIGGKTRTESVRNGLESLTGLGIERVFGDCVDRNQLRRVQTPQAFYYNKIYQAFSDHAKSKNYADDIAVARAAGLNLLK